MCRISIAVGVSSVGLNLISETSFSFDLIKCLLLANAPVFLSRIGGSDTTAVAAYLYAKASGTPDALHEVYAQQAPLTESFNGYYDRNKSETRFFEYCELLANSYHDASYLFFCNHQLLSLCFRNSLNPRFYEENFDHRDAYLALASSLDRQTRTINGFPYNFVEVMTAHPHSLFHVFTEALAGRKVLVVSPFSLSIQVNFKNRKTFFKDYEYPEFQLSVYTTPITYAGLPEHFYPDNDWFDTLARMEADISKLDFDIALLSCGSYAMPLGDSITRKLRRKAIYVGGLLQLYFGIMGRRYDNPFFLNQINVKNFIYPLERHIFLNHLRITEESPAEAFGAYF
jgi:hypothetical protein